MKKFTNKLLVAAIVVALVAMCIYLYEQTKSGYFDLNSLITNELLPSFDSQDDVLDSDTSALILPDM